MLHQAYEGMLREKVLFASGFPLESCEAAIAFWENLGLSDEALECIFYKNAARLLGIA
ncbi:Amidohydrolase [compost metagenome]